MIVTVKNEVNEPEVRLRAPWNEGSRGVHRAAQENETKYFFSSRKFGHISTLPVSPPEDISTRQLAAEAFEHASICSPAWELEFISTIAQFLSTLRSVRLHRKPSTVSFDFRLQGKQQSLTARIICSPACIDLFACMGARVYINNRPIFEHAPICSPS